MIGAKIEAAARSWLKVPYQHQGRNPAVGLDCAGLVVCAWRAVGLPVNDVQGYSRVPHNDLIQACLDGQPAMTRISRAHITPGCVLLIRFNGHPQHLAIASKCGMIHAYERVGRVVEHRIAAGWGSKIVGAYRPGEP